jgi:pyruvate/2-oxoglutarate/acetoin dehydrogenase E1 component
MCRVWRKRVIDTLLQLWFTGIAVGSAMNGCPIVEYMTFNFLFGIDQIINNAAKCVKWQVVSLTYRLFSWQQLRQDN